MVLTCHLQSLSVNPKGDFSDLLIERDLQVHSILEACSFVFQLSKEEGNEEKTEDNLTTLFPGQKRRISHLVKQGNVSAAFRSKSLDSLK